jgi:hypothetical protein
MPRDMRGSPLPPSEGTDDAVSAEGAPGTQQSLEPRALKPPDAASPAAPAAEKSRIDRWSTRFAQWAQICSLGILVFGYFYTVRPVFQLQSIREQASKLQLENDAAAEKLKAKDAAIAISELALTGLQQHVAAITRQRNGLQAALDEENIRERTATQKLADLESRTDEQSKALLRAQRQLLLTNLTWAVRAHQLELPIGSLFYDEEGNFLMDMSSIETCINA